MFKLATVTCLYREIQLAFVIIRKNMFFHEISKNMSIWSFFFFFFFLRILIQIVFEKSVFSEQIVDFDLLRLNLTSWYESMLDARESIRESIKGRSFACVSSRNFLTVWQTKCPTKQIKVNWLGLLPKVQRISWGNSIKFWRCSRVKKTDFYQKKCIKSELESNMTVLNVQKVSFAQAKEQ